MNNNLNEEQIANYSEQVAEKLLNSFFSDKEHISGEEILNFCAIKQVNMFSLKILFQEWKQESKKLESPYFDYENKEVVEAIESFRNTVSRHILVKLGAFKPILIKAIYDSLMLICSPYHFYLNELKLLNAEGKVTSESLSELKKFTKVNFAILEGLITNLNAPSTRTEELDLIKLIDDVVEHLSSGPEDMDSYITAFSNYIPLNLNDIYLEVEELVQEIETIPIPSGNIDEVQEPIPYVASEQTTLNEALASESQQSLADMHEQQKIESLSKGITLNQRFMFVNVLFDGDVAKFNNTVLEVDGLMDLAEAKHYLNVNFSHWNEASYEVEEFMSVLERRFS